MKQELIDRTPVDKSNFGPGPWDGEPDRVEFESAGLPCLLLRGPSGIWCGYVAVPPGHRCHGWELDADVLADIRVHGGLTYAAACDGSRICHIPKPGDPADVWWLGFDCGHAGDYIPKYEYNQPRVLFGQWTDADGHTIPVLDRFDTDPYDHAARLAAADAGQWVDVYRDQAYARAETESLAAQLAAIT